MLSSCFDVSNADAQFHIILNEKIADCKVMDDVASYSVKLCPYPWSCFGVDSNSISCYLALASIMLLVHSTKLPDLTGKR